MRTSPLQTPFCGTSSALLLHQHWSALIMMRILVFKRGQSKWHSSIMQRSEFDAPQLTHMCSFTSQNPNPSTSFTLEIMGRVLQKLHSNQISSTFKEPISTFRYIQTLGMERSQSRYRMLQILLLAHSIDEYPIAMQHFLRHLRSALLLSLPYYAVL